jgi:hypothetical protein
MWPHLLESVRSKLCGLKQASEFVKSRQRASAHIFVNEKPPFAQWILSIVPELFLSLRSEKQGMTSES